MATHYPETVAQIASFGSLGILTVTQDLSGRTTAAFPDFDNELVAEESLCLVSALTAESVASVAGTSELGAAIRTLYAIPYSYRDYLLGQIVLQEKSDIGSGYSENIGKRIGRKMNFYQTHLAKKMLAPSKGIQNIMLLWMGKISSPGRDDSAADRLEKLDAVTLLLRHFKLIASFTSHCLGDPIES